MGLRFTVLASGSTGNAAVVSNGEMNLLVDAGLSARKLEQLLAERGLSGHDLDAVLVTHEHSDHIKGLGTLARKYDLPIYANEGTWEALQKHLGTIAEHNVRVLATGDMTEFGSIQVESYAISHDAAEPVGYCFYEEGQKLSMATDLGYMSDKVRDQLLDSDVLVLESNHDVEMLRYGSYPWNIKRRILSDKGHLSNEAAGEALCEVMGGGTKRVYLAHLSQNHNMMDLARMTVQSVLDQNGMPEEDSRLHLKDTYFDRPTEWDYLDRE